MLVLGIETSCDETGVALVRDGAAVLFEAVASQEQIHAPYAGVVPELASRQHTRLLGPMVLRAVRDSGCGFTRIGLISVTNGPGLAGCLLAGLSFAKGLAYGLGVPILGVNHVEAHICSCLLAGDIEYPAVALVVSGGHTLLVLIKGGGRYELLGQTQDDAVGEAYDKVASMMNLPFPGGPVLEERAGRCRSRSAVVRFPRPLLSSSDLNFSFSGLKTAVLYELKRRAGRPLTPQEVDGIARGFQDAVVEVLLTKALEAVRRTRARCLMLAGGVARNRSLRSALQSAAGEHGIRFLCAPERYCTDNGVMVAALAHRNYAAGFRDDLSLDINPGLRLC